MSETLASTNAGYGSVSVLSKRGDVAPLRIGFWREGKGATAQYVPNVLLSTVEPIAADLLEVKRMASFGDRLTYAPSRNRQSHMYSITERRDARSSPCAVSSSGCPLVANLTLTIFQGCRG